MVRIRTQKELETLYPEHFKVLLGYWLSGMTTREQLDNIVEKLSKKRAKKDKMRAYIQRIQEGRKKAGPGGIYYYQAIEKKTPMVFRCYGGQDIVCTISKEGMDRFTLLADGKREVVWKTALQYVCKAQSREKVEEAVKIDEEVMGRNLEPILPMAERYQIPDKDLLTCKRKGHWLRLTMRGGEVLEGRVEWFGAYDIKLDLATRRSVVAFRHAVYKHAVIQKMNSCMS